MCPHGNGKYLSVQLQGLALLYDLNNINLSIKHMDLFVVRRLHAYAAIFFQTFAGRRADFFLTVREIFSFSKVDEVANICTIDTFYWDIYKLQCH